MKKQIDVFLSDCTVDLWNEKKNRWEKCSFNEAGINDYEDKVDIENYLREQYQERGYDDIDITFV